LGWGCLRSSACSASFTRQFISCRRDFDALAAPLGLMVRSRNFGPAQIPRPRARRLEPWGRPFFETGATWPHTPQRARFGAHLARFSFGSARPLSRFSANRRNSRLVERYVSRSSKLEARWYSRLYSSARR